MIHVLCRDGKTALFDERETVQVIDPVNEMVLTYLEHHG